MRNFSISIFDELEPLYPDSKIHEELKHYNLACASNTYGGIHILLKDLTPGEPVIFKVKGPNKRFKLFNLLPVPVETNTGVESRSELLDNKFNPHVIRRAPFMIYEVLKPIINVCTAEYSTMAFAFRCKVDLENNSEFTNWEITVIHGEIEKTITLTIENFDCRVNDAGAESYPYINWLSDSAIASSHHVPIWSKHWEILLEKYLKMCHYGRQNMFCIWPNWCFDIDENNIPILNEAKLLKLINIADNSGIHWICGGTIACRKNGEWDASSAEISLTKQPIPGSGEKVLEDMCKSLYTFINKNNLSHRWIQSFLDEPLDALSECYKIGTSIIKKCMPNISILDASIARETIEDTLDIWCPTVDKYEKYNEFFAKRKNQGDKVFVYTCLNPAGNFCNRQLDVERLRQVYLGWAPGKYDVDGFLHWGGNMYDMMNPFERSAVTFGWETAKLDSVNYDLDDSSTLPAGDNALIYPGFNTPFSSTRLESHRIGFEDLELLQIAKEKNLEKTLAIINKLFRSYDNFEKDVQLYRKVKYELLTFICE